MKTFRIRDDGSVKIGDMFFSCCFCLFTTCVLKHHVIALPETDSIRCISCTGESAPADGTDAGGRSARPVGFSRPSAIQLR